MKLLPVLLLSLLLGPGLTHAGEASVPASGELVKMSSDLELDGLKPAKGAQLSLEKDGDAFGLKVEFAADDGYPGVFFPAPPPEWDLSAFRGVESEITNLGAGKVSVTVRVDNAGDWTTNPWSAEATELEPGETKTITVNFGNSFGKPAFALDPKKITGIHVLANSPKEEGVLLIRSLKAVQ